MTDLPEWRSIEETAAFLGITIRSVQILAQRGRLLGFKSPCLPDTAARPRSRWTSVRWDTVLAYAVERNRQSRKDSDHCPRCTAIKPPDQPLCELCTILDGRRYDHLRPRTYLAAHPFRADLALPT